MLKNVESRTIGELGTGLTFFNKKEGDLEKLYLRLDLAARAGYETRFQYFPTPSSVTNYGIVILAPRVAITFRWNFSKDVRLTEALALTTGVLVNVDTMPPEGAGGVKRKETDVALTAGIEASF